MEPEGIVITFCAYAIAFCWHNHFSECGVEKEKYEHLEAHATQKKKKRTKRGNLENVTNVGAGPCIYVAQNKVVAQCHTG